MDAGRGGALALAQPRLRPGGLMEPVELAGPSAAGRRGGGAGPAAVLWDMDGTLCDTEPYWIETEFALAERFGGQWSEADALELVGNDLLESGRYIRRRMGLEISPEEIVELLLDGVVER